MTGVDLSVDRLSVTNSRRRLTLDDGDSDVISSCHVTGDLAEMTSQLPRVPRDVVGQRRLFSSAAITLPGGSCTSVPAGTKGA